MRYICQSLGSRREGNRFTPPVLSKIRPIVVRWCKPNKHTILVSNPLRLWKVLTPTLLTANPSAIEKSIGKKTRSFFLNASVMLRVLSVSIPCIYLNNKLGPRKKRLKCVAYSELIAIEFFTLFVRDQKQLLARNNKRFLN